jgi:hypothetical protein
MKEGSQKTWRLNRRSPAPIVTSSAVSHAPNTVLLVSVLLCIWKEFFFYQTIYSPSLISQSSLLFCFFIFPPFYTIYFFCFVLNIHGNPKTPFHFQLFCHQNEVFLQKQAFWINLLYWKDWMNKKKL